MEPLLTPVTLQHLQVPATKKEKGKLNQNDIKKFDHFSRTMYTQVI